MKHQLKEYIIATRPWSFPASAMPVAVTLAALLGQGQNLNWFYGIWALFNIVLFHAAGNMWSDYFDYKHKVDDQDTYGAKCLTENIFTPREIFRYAFGMLLVAIVGGLLLAWLTGWELLVIGGLGAVFTLLYPTLKFRAMGDVVIFICYALLPTLGTSFVASDIIDPSLLWVTLPGGLITVAILHANNTRDVRTDRRAGIRTLAMNVGHRVSQALYLAEVLLPYLIVLLCAFWGVLPWWALISFLALPLSIHACRAMLKSAEGDAADIIGLDELSAKLQLVFSLLLIFSLVIDHFL